MEGKGGTMFGLFGSLCSARQTSFVASVKLGSARRGVLLGGLLAFLGAAVLALGAANASATSITDTVAVSPSAGSVAMGSSLSYTITLGPSFGIPATMVDQIDGMTNLSVTQSSGSCTQSAGLVTCQTTLAQVTTVTISGIVTAPAGTVLHDVALVSSQTGQPVTSASAEADVQVTGGTVPPGPGSGIPDLVTSIVAPATVPAGVPLTYTLVVGNPGTGNANNVNVVDTLPAGLGSPAVTNATSLFGCSVSGETVNCSGGRIDAGADATITITGTAPASGTLTDLANVDPYDTIPESNYNNNTSQALTTVAPNPAANSLAVSYSAAPSPDVAQGSTLTYTLKVTNTQPTGGAAISDIGVIAPTQGLDPASIAIGLSLPAGQSQNVALACGVSGATVQCFSADNDSSEVSLAPGQSMTVTISGTVIAPPAQKIFGEATVVGGQSNPNANAVSTTATTQIQVKPAIDLSITKESLAPTVNAAAPFQYQYVVGNSGLHEAMGVVIRDPLPAAILPPHGGYTFTVSPGSGFICSIDANNVLTCTGGMIGAQSTATITVNLIAPETTGTYTSIVQVDPNDTIPESDKNNNSASATTTVVPGADLVADGVPCTTTSGPGQSVAPGPGPVCQSVDFNPVATSGTLDYTITVPNTGTQDVSGVVVQDTLPAGTTFRNATGDHNFTCSDSGQTVTCVGGIIKGTYSNFPSGVDTATITIGVFAPAAPGQITNEVRLDPNNQIPETNKANNISYLTTAVAVESGAGNGNYIDLSIPKLESNPDPVAPNGTLTYTMTVQNTGTEQAFNVEVSDTLPTGARFRSASGTGGFTCSASGQVVSCVGGEIDNAAGANPTRTITINAFAPPEPGAYIDQAIVDPNNKIPEANESNNEATVTTNVKRPSEGGGGVYNDLTIESEESPMAPGETVLPDGLVTYTLKVSNLGSATAFEVETDDSLPADSTFLSAVATSGTCQLASDGHTVKCIGATVAKGSPETITIVVRAPNESSGQPAGTVKVGPDSAIVNPNNEIPEASTENNSTEQPAVEVLSNIDLAIEQSGPATASQNGTPSYTLTVKNEGTGNAYGVLVRDPLPVGLIVQNIASEPNTFGCQASENPVNVIECTGELPAGKSVTITIGTFVTAADSTTLTNEACVNPNHTIVEFNYTNNCSTVETVANEPDLAVSQSASISPISPGQNEVYTIGVQNTGKSAAHNSEMTDKLPTGMTFVSATGTNGTKCSNAGQLVTCKMGEVATGGSVTIMLTATVTPSASGPIVNTASVSTTDTETDLKNNSESTTVNLNGTGIDLAAESMTTNQDPVNNGAVLVYTSMFKNLGSQEAQKALIEQVLPSTGAEFVGASGSGGFNCVPNKTPEPTSVQCTGNLAAGAATTITVKVKVTAKAPAALTSTITADPKNEIAETDKTNNSKSVTTTVTASTCKSCYALVMGSLLSSPTGQVKTKDPLTYTFTVGNAGDEATPTSPGPKSEAGVVIADFLETGNVEFKKAEATDGFATAYDEELGIVFAFQSQCSLIEKPFLQIKCPEKPTKASVLAAGAGVIVNVTTQVKEPALKTKIKNFAEVFEVEGEFNVYNKEETIFTEVFAEGPLLRGAAAPLSALPTPTGTSAAKASGSARTQTKCRLPNLRHMGKAQAQRALLRAHCMNVAVRFRGRGSRVVHQAIRAGTVISKRTLLVLSLGRA